MTNQTDQGTIDLRLAKIIEMATASGYHTFGMSRTRSRTGKLAQLKKSTTYRDEAFAVACELTAALNQPAPPVPDRNPNESLPDVLSREIRTWLDQWPDDGGNMTRFEYESLIDHLTDKMAEWIWDRES